jgi:predicted nucleic acid-binding protein
MSARYLLDTDWVIHYLNANTAIVQRVDACRTDGVAVSIVTVAELYERIYVISSILDQHRPSTGQTPRSRRRRRSQLKRLRAEPLNADDGDQGIREDAAHGCVGLEVFEAGHGRRLSISFTCFRAVRRGAPSFPSSASASVGP